MSGPRNELMPNTSFKGRDENGLDALTAQTDFLAEWGDPDLTILDDRRGALPEFPADALIGQVRDYIGRASMGAGVTFAHVAVPLLSIASGILGTARRIQASRSWTEPLSIWCALVGFSGTGKTPGIGVTKRALNEIERSRKEKFAALERDHETRAETAKAAYKKWLKDVDEATEGGLPPPPMPASATKLRPFVAPRIHITDSTIERIAVLLEARPAGLQVIADELAGLFANMCRYSSGSDREFWLEAWNGRSYTVERMGRPAVTLEHLLVGITGGLQPDKLVRAFEGDDDGMYARICFAWPAEPSYRPLSNEVAEIEPELINALEKIARLGDSDNEGNFAPRTVSLSVSALTKFETFRQFLHDEKSALDGRDREWWAKGGTQVLRLAGTLSFLTWAWGDHKSEPREIDAKFVEAAITVWRDYFWPHSRAALRQIGVSRSHSHARRALLWIRAQQKEDVSLMDIRRDALGQRLDGKQTRAVMETLVQANWLKAHTSPTGGRPSQRWWVNPALYWDAATAGSAGSPTSLPVSALSALSAALPEDKRRNQQTDPDGWTFHLDAEP
jgi:Protein of unknown function (DUF3987)